MSDPSVGDTIKRHFVATFRQVGAFETIRHGDRGFEAATAKPPIKTGGNVVSYFCTPQGEVLFFVVGPVDASDFTGNAQWTVATYGEIRRHPKGEWRSRTRKAHLDRVLLPNTASRNAKPKDIGRLVREAARLHRGRRRATDYAHSVLSAMPLAKLGELERAVFEEAAGEKFIQGMERRDELVRAMRENRRQRQPTLLVLTQPEKTLRVSNPGEVNVSIPEKSAALLSLDPVFTLARQFKGIHLDALELTTLLDALDEPPAVVIVGQELRFIIYDASGHRVEALGDEAKKRHLASVLEGALITSGLLSEELEQFVRDSPKRAKEAARQLRLADFFLEVKPTQGRERLRKIVKDFPGTAAAATAREMLSQAD